MDLMLSREFREHFPIRTRAELQAMPQDDKKLLSVWVRSFHLEVFARERKKSGHGMMKFYSYRVSEEDCSRIATALMMGWPVEESDLFYVNAVLYRHKYNSLVSIFVFPFLSEEKWQMYIS